MQEFFQGISDDAEFIASSIHRQACLLRGWHGPGGRRDARLLKLGFTQRPHGIGQFRTTLLEGIYRLFDEGLLR